MWDSACANTFDIHLLTCFESYSRAELDKFSSLTNRQSSSSSQFESVPRGHVKPSGSWPSMYIVIVHMFQYSLTGVSIAQP